MINLSKEQVMGILDENLGDNLSINLVGFNTGNPSALTAQTNSSSNLSFTTSDPMYSGTATITNAVYTMPNTTLTGWGYFQNYYYPQVIRESYPIYLQERAQDKGKQAFEIIKALQDKKFLKLDKVSDFIDAMDTLIKIV